MHVTVVSPEQAVFDGAADAIVAPAYDGQVGILPRHAPFLTLIGTGVLHVRQGSASSRFRVAGEFDHLPEQAFYMVAGIDEALEQAKRLATS